MEAQLQRPTHGDHSEEDPQMIEGEHVGEHNQQGEKKSVLKKVKDKAKKIKDTIKKHGQGNEHDYRNDENPEEEEDEDEETVNGFEIHGAPICESTVIRSTNLPRQIDDDVEKPTDTREDRYDPIVKDEGLPRPSAPWQMGNELERPPAMERHTHENKNASSPINQSSRQREEADAGEPRIKIGPPMGLEEDPHSPKNRPGEVHPNYQSKVTDPTGDGGKEAGVAPLIRRFDNLNVYDDESDIKPESEQRSYTGSHNQFAAQPIPTKDQFNTDMPVSTLDNCESNPISVNSNKAEGMPRDTITGKISSATSAITDRAVSAKNVVASKLGYGGSSQEEGQDSSKKPVSESAAEYAYKAAEKLAPVYEKVAGAGTAVLSKVQSSGGGAENQGKGDKPTVEGTDKGVSMTGYLAEKFTPGDEDKALSEVITDALYKKKEGTQKTGEEEQPMGKVTESEEVAARLGTGTEKKREGEDALAAGHESSGAGVVDRLKDAVSLWLGKSTGMQTAQDLTNQSYVSDVGSDPVGVGGRDDEVTGGQQPRLQESGN